MSDKPKTDKPDGKRWGLARHVWIVVAVLVLYPLSLGPMTWLDQHNHVPSGVMLVYRPFWNIRVDRGPGRLLRQWEVFWRDL